MIFKSWADKGRAWPLLVLFFGLAFAISLLRTMVPTQITDLVALVFVAAGAYTIFRFMLTVYVYEFTDDTLTAYRQSGRRNTQMFQIDRQELKAVEELPKDTGETPTLTLCPSFQPKEYRILRFQTEQRTMVLKAEVSRDFVNKCKRWIETEQTGVDNV